MSSDFFSFFFTFNHYIYIDIDYNFLIHPITFVHALFYINITICMIQGDQLNMTVFFCYLVKSDLSSVRYRTRVHRKSNLLQGTGHTQPCLTGHPVLHILYCNCICPWAMSEVSRYIFLNIYQLYIDSVREAAKKVFFFSGP